MSSRILPAVQIAMGVAWVREHQRYPGTRELGPTHGLPSDVTLRRDFGSVRGWCEAVAAAAPDLPGLPARGAPRSKPEKPWQAHAGRRLTASQRALATRTASFAAIDLDSPLGPPVSIPQVVRRAPEYGDHMPQMRGYTRRLVQIRHFK